MDPQGSASPASTEDSTVRRRQRRRRANVVGGRPVEHKVRVSVEEEAVLVRLAEAAHITVPRLLVESAMAAEGPMRAEQARELLTTLFGLQRLLGSVAWNVNQMAAAVHGSGAAPGQMAAVFDAALRVGQRIDAVIESMPTVSQISAAEHTRRRRRVTAVFGEKATVESHAAAAASGRRGGEAR